MARLGLVIPDELESRLKVESDEQQQTISAIVRIALGMYFASRGKSVKTDVRWGGPKDRGKAQNEGAA